MPEKFIIEEKKQIVRIMHSNKHSRAVPQAWSICCTVPQVEGTFPESGRIDLDESPKGNEYQKEMYHLKRLIGY